MTVRFVLSALSLTLLLFGCSYAVEPNGWARAQELCAPAAGLAYLEATGAYRDGSRTYTATCRDNTTIDFTTFGKGP